MSLFQKAGKIILAELFALKVHQFPLISCQLSWQFAWNVRSCFSGKNKRNINLSSAELAQRVVNVSCGPVPLTMCACSVWSESSSEWRHFFQCFCSAIMWTYSLLQASRVILICIYHKYSDRRACAIVQTKIKLLKKKWMCSYFRVSNALGVRICGAKTNMELRFLVFSSLARQIVDWLTSSWYLNPHQMI